MGDLNSYNTPWGSEYTNVRGRILEEVAYNKGLIIMNTGAPTRIGFNTETCIDLTVSSPTLGPYLAWTVTSSPFDSDHIPIIVSVLTRERNMEEERWNMRKADWKKYKEHEVWKALPQDIQCEENRSILQEFYSRLEEAIPKTKSQKYFSKPYWTTRIKETRNQRKVISQV